MTEAEMVMDCYSKLKMKDIYKEVVLEVPYLSRCIDMVIIDDEYKILSVEFKLKDWRRALEQAKDHKLGADKSYICIPQKSKEIPANMIEALNKAGVGLMLYKKDDDDPLEEIISPISHNDKWEPWVISLKNLVNRISEKQIF